MTFRLTIPLCVAALASAACGVTTSDQSVVAVLRGVVTSGANVPVHGARITVTVVDSVTQMLRINEAAGTTDITGHFERLMGVSLAPEFTGHVTIMVSPPASAALPDTTFVAGYLAFRFGVPDTLSLALAYP